MKTIDDVRRDKLIRLKDQCGSYAAFGRKIKRSRAQAWSWINDQRHISTAICREIEGIFNKPNGWMDADLKGDEDLSLILGVEVTELSEEKRELIKALLKVPDSKIKDLQSIVNLLHDRRRKDDK